MKKVDVTYFLLCKLLQLTNTIRYSYIWVAGNVVRILILCVVSVEGVRSITQVVCLVYIVFSRLERIILCLSCFDKRPNRFRFCTNIAGMEFASVKELLDVVIYVAFTFMFWMLVSGSCVLITNSPKEISFLLYSTCAATAIIILAILLALLPFAARQMDAYKLAVKQNTQNARVLNVAFKTKSSLFSLKQSVSILCIEIRCGCYGKISQEFANQYFSDIVLRCFDAILLF